ncbi:MAG TPA: extracellular solute-binding protein [Chloroflexota bacterium]|nr:extracellular solute-binding protein [Chloroflexota bacterium]
MRTSSLPQLCLALSLTLGLAACGGSAAGGSAAAPASSSVAASAAVQGGPEWEKVVAAAKQEGKVVLGVPPGPQYQPAISAAFEKAYPGIKVEITNIHAADFTARIAKERAAGEYAWDVWVGGTDIDVYRLAHEGILDPIKPEVVLPEALEDRNWLGGFDAGFGDSAKKYAMNLAATNSDGAFVNRDLITESALATFDDLWKPDWKGKFVWQDARQSGSGVNAAAVILKIYGEQKLRDLWTNQQVVVSTDERQMAEWVVRGTKPIGLGLVRNRGLEILRQEGVGLNVKSVRYPITLNSPGAHALVAVNRPPHPNARKVMLNWLLGREAGTVLAQAAKLNSRRLDVPVTDPNTQVPQGVETVNTQGEDFAPLRLQANKIAAEVFK